MCFIFYIILQYILYRRSRDTFYMDIGTCEIMDWSAAPHHNLLDWFWGGRGSGPVFYLLFQLADPDVLLMSSGQNEIMIIISSPFVYIPRTIS